jgi:hypothetical protein
MISPDFLSTLRGRLRSELLITMVQLEQRCPGWWRDLGQLAEEISTDRSSLNRCVLQLERRDLIRCHRTSGQAPGCWLWWVKRSNDDQPHARDEPGWVLKNVRNGQRYRVALSRRHQWAADHQIPGKTLSSFLYGHHRLLRDEWLVVSSPFQ